LSYQNINAATFSGFEVSHLWRLSKRLEYKWTLNWSDNRDEKGNPIPNTIPFSVSGYLNFNFFNNLLKSSISSKWVAPYKPQEFDIRTATYISSEEKISGYAIINIRTTMKIKESINLSLVLDNVGNYTNDNFGPFVGRAAYLELSTALTKKDIK
jgi:Outer membrane receptor for ferrienterochelin and colicins